MARSHSIAKEQVKASYLLHSLSFSLPLSSLSLSFPFSSLFLSLPFSSLSLSLPFSSLFLFSFTYICTPIPLSHTQTPTDSVVFARLNEEASPLKKVTLNHLAVSTLPSFRGTPAPPPPPPPYPPPPTVEPLLKDTSEIRTPG